jgi:hypothetical protein
MTITINGTTGISGVNGTAAAPAMVGTDTDTGVYYGTNTVLAATAGTERMRISNVGGVFINTATTLGSAGARLNMLWNNIGEQAITLKASTTTFNGGPMVFLNSVDGTSGTIGQTVSSVSYNTSSDYRLKENITPMTGALAKVQALKPVTYTWKIDGANGQGFIAHELQEVVPECVTGEKDAVNENGSIKAQGVDTSFLVATLTAAIQELKAELDSVKAELVTLKA